MLRKFLRLTAVSCLILDLTGCAAAVVSGAVAGTAMLHDRRTPGTIVDDQSLELKAQQSIRKMNLGSEAHVSAISYNNNILLVGQVPSSTTKNNIESTIRDIEKVRRIYNEITIEKATGMNRRTQDAWITTRIKSNLVFNDALDGTRIKVYTEDGIVYLMGLVNSEEEEHAVDVARHVEGVEKVIKLFESAS